MQYIWPIPIKSITKIFQLYGRDGVYVYFVTIGDSPQCLFDLLLFGTKSQCDAFKGVE